MDHLHHWQSNISKDKVKQIKELIKCTLITTSNWFSSLHCKLISNVSRLKWKNKLHQTNKHFLRKKKWTSGHLPYHALCKLYWIVLARNRRCVEASIENFRLHYDSLDRNDLIIFRKKIERWFSGAEVMRMMIKCCMVKMMKLTKEKWLIEDTIWYRPINFMCEKVGQDEDSGLDKRLLNKVVNQFRKRARNDQIWVG